MGYSITKEQVTALLSKYIKQFLSEDDKIHAINFLRKKIHELSPFSQEPVDCVLWVKGDSVVANDYNPNVMAPAEKKLLLRSLLDDGFTQPVVVSEERDHYLVVDGFHRQLLGKDKKYAGKRFKGWLPVTCVKSDRKGVAERISATIRHNRARGKHQIASMSDIVRDLSRLGWSDERIGNELGMEQDEVLRLKQISGLTELFQDDDFSPSWTVR